MEAPEGNLRLAGLATALRLVLVPAAFVAMGVWLGFRGEELGAILIVFCAPTAISSYVMAQNMGSDDELAGQLVLTTTLFSSVTIFFVGYSAARYAVNLICNYLKFES